jgi:hypothetical protein
MKAGLSLITTDQSTTTNEEIYNEGSQAATYFKCKETVAGE